MFDILKFLVMVLWELNDLGVKQYSALSKKLNTIGTMLNKWLKYIENDAMRRN